jgi:sugar-specific transcriptional regulator TrmB
VPKDIEVIRKYFAKLKLEPEIADLYLTLNAYGPQTISELARNSEVERTRIYRLLDIMSDLHLCETEIRYKRSVIKPAPADNLQILIARREQELRDLQAEFGDVEKILHSKKAMQSPSTRVQFYKGDAGLKQMFWNESRSQTENVSILYESMQMHTRAAFFERWVRKCNERNMHFRSVVSDHFLESLKTWYSAHQNERLDHWKGRYVPDSTFSVTHSMVVYNDVVSYYNWKAGEIFGIEIYNQELADAQRHFFEMLWAQGSDLSKEQAKPHLDEDA